MGIIESADGTIYCTRNGKRVPANITPISAAINDQNMFHYNSSSGALKLNREMIQKGILEKIAEQIEKSPKKETDISLDLPFEGPVLVKGVKSVAYFTSEEAVSLNSSNIRKI
ncbi:MAG: hypothetical protein ABIH65_03510 [Nanoarchaeota archaeon]